jgi:uncharacterized membrane protein
MKTPKMDKSLVGSIVSFILVVIVIFGSIGNFFISLNKENNQITPHLIIFVVMVVLLLIIYCYINRDNE